MPIKNSEITSIELTHTCGFLIDHSCKLVALVEKDRPEHLKGLWNGIGGNIEPELDANIYATQTREFEEETGLLFREWNLFGFLDTQFSKIAFFYGFAPARMLYHCRTVTDENIDVFNINALPPRRVPNLDWLIPMALSMRNESCSRFEIKES